MNRDYIIEYLILQFLLIHYKKSTLTRSERNEVLVKCKMLICKTQYQKF